MPTRIVIDGESEKRQIEHVKSWEMCVEVVEISIITILTHS